MPLWNSRHIFFLIWEKLFDFFFSLMLFTMSGFILSTVLRSWVKVCVLRAAEPRRRGELSVQHRLLLLWWWVISAGSAGGFLLSWLQAIMLFALTMLLIGLPPFPWQRQRRGHVSFGPARCCVFTDGLFGR